MSAEFIFESKTPLLKYSQEDVEKVLAQYNRNIDNISEDVLAVRNWLDSQPHLTVKPLDRFIISFLKLNKFSVEKAKEKLDFFYTIRSLIPEYFNNKLPTSQAIRDVQKCISFVPLPTLVKHSRRLVFVKFEQKKSQYFSFDAFVALSLMIQELRSLQDFSNGDEYILDINNVDFGLISKISPMDIKRVAVLAEKVYSNRVNAIHFLNLPSYAETLLAIVRSAVKPKIKERIHVHKDVESLREFYSDDVLPEDCGGTGPLLSELKGKWQELLEENEGYFKISHGVRVNESLRPKKLINDDILGFHGNFRQLQVD